MKHWKSCCRAPWPSTACLESDPNLDKFTLALLSLEILGLARSVLHNDGRRSWFATDELEWLTSRDYVSLLTAAVPRQHEFEERRRSFL